MSITGKTDFDRELPRLRPRLKYFASRRVNNPEDVEDLVQGTCLDTWRSIENNGPIEVPYPWMKVALQYRINRFNGQKSRRDRLAPTLQLGGLEDEIIDDHGDVVYDPRGYSEGVNPGGFLGECRGMKDQYPGWSRRPSSLTHYRDTCNTSTDSYLVLLQAVKDLLLRQGVGMKHIRRWYLFVCEEVELKEIARREGLRHYQTVQQSIYLVRGKLEKHRDELAEVAAR